MPRGRERRLREMALEKVRNIGFEDAMPLPYEEAMNPAFHGLFPWHCKNSLLRIGHKIGHKSKVRGNGGVRKE